MGHYGDRALRTTSGNIVLNSNDELDSVKHLCSTGYPGYGRDDDFHDSEIRCEEEHPPIRAGPSIWDWAAGALEPDEITHQRYQDYLARPRKELHDDGTAVWTPELDAQFQIAVRLIPNMGKRKTPLSIKGRPGVKKPAGRNELLEHHLSKMTGKDRARKKMSSHIQVFKGFYKKDSKLHKNATVRPDGTPLHISYDEERCMLLIDHKPPFVHLPILKLEMLRIYPKIGEIPCPRHDTDASNAVDRLEFKMHGTVSTREERASGTGKEFHNFTTVQSDIGAQPILLADVPAFQDHFPQLQNLLVQDTYHKAEIILIESDLCMIERMPEHGTVGLTIIYNLDVSHSRLSTRWSVKNTFYDSVGRCTRQQMYQIAPENVTHQMPAKTRLKNIPFGSASWVQFFHQLMSDKAKLMMEAVEADTGLALKGHLRCNGCAECLDLHVTSRHAKRTAERLSVGAMQEKSVMQEVFAVAQPSISPTEGSECVAIILWRFRQASAHTAPLTTWRKLIRPLPEYALGSMTMSTPPILPSNAPADAPLFQNTGSQGPYFLDVQDNVECYVKSDIGHDTSLDIQLHFGNRNTSVQSSPRTSPLRTSSKKLCERGVTASPRDRVKKRRDLTKVRVLSRRYNIELMTQQARQLDNQLFTSMIYNNQSHMVSSRDDLGTSLHNGDAIHYIHSFDPSTPLQTQATDIGMVTFEDLDEIELHLDQLTDPALTLDMTPSAFHINHIPAVEESTVYLTHRNDPTSQQQESRPNLPSHSTGPAKARTTRLLDTSSNGVEDVAEPVALEYPGRATSRPPRVNTSKDSVDLHRKLNAETKDNGEDVTPADDRHESGDGSKSDCDWQSVPHTPVEVHVTCTQTLQHPQPHAPIPMPALPNSPRLRGCSKEIDSTVERSGSQNSSQADTHSKLANNGDRAVEGYPHSQAQDAANSQEFDRVDVSQEQTVFSQATTMASHLAHCPWIQHEEMYPEGLLGEIGQDVTGAGWVLGEVGAYALLNWEGEFPAFCTGSQQGPD